MSESPLSRAFRPFIGSISMVAFGSNSPVRQTAGGCPVIARSRRPESTLSVNSWLYAGRRAPTRPPCGRKQAVVDQPTPKVLSNTALATRERGPRDACFRAQFDGLNLEVRASARNRFARSDDRRHIARSISRSAGQNQRRLAALECDQSLGEQGRAHSLRAPRAIAERTLSNDRLPAN
jgi:hypothetical protein